MLGAVVSVNLAVARTLRSRGQDVATGIYKEPAAGRVRLTRLSFEGDFQVDRRYHGGLEKAVYLYPLEHYSYWKQVLGRSDLSPGFFGENLTTQGLWEREIRAGDVLRVGDATVAVTRPRSPCFKLGLKVGSARFVKTFLESGRLGFYLTVVEEGSVGAGDRIDRVATDPSRPLIADLSRR